VIQLVWSLWAVAWFGSILFRVRPSSTEASPSPSGVGEGSSGERNMSEPGSSVLLSVRVEGGTIPLRPHAVVTGNLNLEGLGAIVSLPESLVINGDLLLRGTSIQSLPRMLDVRGQVDLEGCRFLNKLAENLTVGGDLVLEGCEGVARLRRKLVVGGNLYLAGTHVRSVPSSAIIGGTAYDLATH
jgi:hypothetical protein